MKNNSVTVNETEYRADIHGDHVSICRLMSDGRWESVGIGRWKDGEIVDCDAPLGDDVFEALTEQVATSQFEAFLNGFTVGSEIGRDQAFDCWAAYSRQLTDSERRDEEARGYRRGMELGSEYKSAK
jgi:hypothetical protein